MPSLPLSPEKLADAKALAQAIREATAADIDELARTLVATDDTHPFGQTEFTVRDLAHQIAAKALTQHLARKKSRTANLAELSSGCVQCGGGWRRLPHAHATTSTSAAHPQSHALDQPLPGMWTHALERVRR